MFSFKDHQPLLKKHQDKNVHQVNSSISSQSGIKNDNIAGMMQKNYKPKVASSGSAFSPNKIKIIDSKSTEQPNSTSHQIQSANKFSEKRKDDKINHSVHKKIKTDTSSQESEILTEGSSTKKTAKLKSMFPKTYICKYCCRRYHSVEQLQQHTNTEHANKPTHVCHLCNHQAASFSALMTHYLRHSGNKDNIEKIYAKSKADFSNIQFNMFSRPKTSSRCAKCKLTFNSKSKYDAHNCSEIPKKSEYNCAYCRHVSTTVEDYRNHIQSHSETPFTCSYCQHKSMTKKQFDTHREICKVRLKSNIQYKCEMCNVFSCKNKKELTLHSKTCGETTVHTCEKCSAEFQEKKNYEDHLLSCEENGAQNAGLKNSDKPSTCLKSSNKQNTSPKSSNKQKTSLKNTNKQKSPTKKTNKIKKRVKVSTDNKNKLICCVCDLLCYSKAEHEEHENECLAEMAEQPNKVAATLCSTCGNTIDVDKITEHSRTCCLQNFEKQILNIENPNARRSTRLVRRKSSFIDNDDAFQKPSTRLIRRRRSSIVDDNAAQNPSTHLFSEEISVIDDDDSIIDISSIPGKSSFTDDDVDGIIEKSSTPRKSSCTDDDSTIQKSSTPKKSPVTDDDNAIQRSSSPRKNSFTDNKDEIHKTSTRLVSRKISFADDNDFTRKQKPLKLKISKNSKLLKLKPKSLKPKFRKGRQSKNSNNSFRCNFCDFTFCSKSTLLRHKRMHSGNPWYICQYCGKFFFRKDVYIRHEVNVHKSPKSVFYCYYCKLSFNESSLLREHVVAVHKESAFLPIKHNLSETDIEDSPVKSGIAIKQESSMTDSNYEEAELDASPYNSNNHISGSSPAAYKCTECFECFVNAISLKNHLRSHVIVSPNKNIAGSSKSVGQIRKKHFKTTKESTQLSDNVSEVIESVIASSGRLCNQSVKTDNLQEETMVSKRYEETTEKTISDKISDIDELASKSNISTADTQSFVCELCSKCFTRQNLLDDHSKILHKLMDWYQCLVCSFSGPKEEMLKHMLIHMYKVGSFVVGDIADFNTIISSDSPKETVWKTPCVSNCEQDVHLSKDVVEVSYDDLPPLREYGICPCISRHSEQRDENLCPEESVLEIDPDEEIQMPDLVQEAKDLYIDMKEQISTSLHESISVQDDDPPIALCPENIFHEIDNTSEKEKVLAEVEATEEEEIEASKSSSPVKGSGDTPCEVNTLPAIQTSEDAISVDNHVLPIVNVSANKKVKSLCSVVNKKGKKHTKIRKESGQHFDSVSQVIESVVQHFDSVSEVIESVIAAEGETLIEIETSKVSTPVKESINALSDVNTLPAIETRENAISKEKCVLPTVKVSVGKKTKSSKSAVNKKGKKCSKTIKESAQYFDSVTEVIESVIAASRSLYDSLIVTNALNKMPDIETIADVKSGVNTSLVLQSSESPSPVKENPLLVKPDINISFVEETSEDSCSIEENMSHVKSDVSTSLAIDTSEFSSPVKESIEDIKSFIMDCNQTENFSQLRYLLQSPGSHHKSESRSPFYNYSPIQNPDFLFDKPALPLNLASQENSSLNAINLVMNEMNFTSSNLVPRTESFASTNLECKIGNFASANLVPKTESITSTNLVSKTDSFIPSNSVSRNDVNFTSSNSASKGYMNFLSPNSLTRNDINYSSTNLISKNGTNTSSNLLSKNDMNFTFSKHNFGSNQSVEKACAVSENNQSSNTCLRFDINQSRSEFSENFVPTLLNQKSQITTEFDKSDSLFKACPSQNTILDFSDLIQHSFENSSPTDDNIFSFGSPKPVDSHDSIGMREEVRTPDCSEMVDYDSSGYITPVKCENCNTYLRNQNEQIHHKCSSSLPPEQTSVIDFSHSRSKSIFQSSGAIGVQGKNASGETVAGRGVSTATSPTEGKVAGIVVCSLCTKVFPSEIYLLRHQKIEHAPTLLSSSTVNKCTKCHRTFPDIGELMKHSLVCLRTYFSRAPASNDCLSSPEMLQSLFKKDESKTNFSTFPVNSPLLFNTFATESTHQTSEDLLKRFNS